MTPAHRIEIVLLEDGKMSLNHLPFRVDQAVEVIVLLAAPSSCFWPRTQGYVPRYDNAATPVAECEWDTLVAGYQQIALDEAREAEALEWAKATVEDVANEARRGVAGQL